jgi:hypothetical protein
VATATVAAKSIPERRAALRRARAAVLTGLSAFALLMAATYFVERRLPQLIDPVYHGRLQYLRKQRAADPAHTPTVVLLGSSRTFQGVDAVRLSGCLSAESGRPVAVANWGIPGGGFVTDLLTWRRLRRDGVHPDLLLIEVMPALFMDGSTQQLDERAMPASRLDGFDLRVLSRYRAGTRPGLERDVALASASPLYGRRFALTRALAPRLLPSADENNNPYVWPVNVSFHPYNWPAATRAKALDRARENWAGSLTHFQPGRCEALRELLTSCLADGVRPVLLVTPEGPAYRSWYAPETWPTIQAWLDEIHREYGVEVINAREWLDKEEDFADSHHLLPQGAERFSERLGREYMLPALKFARDDGV